MSKPDDGGDAFPFFHENKTQGVVEGSSGMSLRDWFAGQAMAGWIGSLNGTPSKLEDHAFAHLADVFYSVADAMLKARAL